MKTMCKRLVALALSAALLMLCLCGCGGKSYTAGDYSGSVLFEHELDVDGTTVTTWGANVTVTIDEDGVIWDVQAEAPEGATLSTQFLWTAHDGQFYSSITGQVTVDEIMAITVETEEDGFPVLYGDCSGIDTNGVDITLLNTYEVSCALVILAMQDAFTTAGLA